MGSGGHFWSDSLSEPKKAYNWIMVFNGIPSWVLKTVTKPNFTITETTQNFLGHTFYHPGRVEWQAIDCTLGDPVQPDSAASMMHLLRQMGYDYPSGEDWAIGSGNSGPTSISKQKAVTAMGVTEIRQLNGDGQPLESWELINPFITKAEFGTLDYASDEMVEIAVSIRYDYAIMTTGEAATRVWNAAGASPKPNPDGHGGGVI
jgi:hypothetical protein